MKNVKGFTLIELVAVIVILGILAVTAVPQFLDLRTSARDSAAAGVGGAMASASSLNYARGVAQGGATIITACNGAGWSTLLNGATISGSSLTYQGVAYNLTSSTGATSGSSLQCGISHPQGSVQQSFTLIGCATTTSCT